MLNPYEYADEQIAQMKRDVNAEFTNAHLAMSFDKLNVISVVKPQIINLYNRLMLHNRRIFRRVVEHAYDDAVEEVKESGEEVDSEEIAQKKKDSIQAVLFILNGTIHPVSGYDYRNETIRKRDRLFERVFSVQTRLGLREAFAHAAKLWANQSRQYIDYHVDEARKTAFRDAGIEYVEWVTRRDNKVCPTCGERNGKIYHIDSVPEKAHQNCRCTIRPIKRTL